MMRCKIKIVKDIPDIFQKYCPQKGEIYDAEWVERNAHYKFVPMCIVEIAGRRIVVREGEYEVLGV